MDEQRHRQTCFTYELTEDQQELLLGLMVNGNYRRREVPYALYSIEGERFNATLYEKERHGRRRLCIQGSGAEDFVLFRLEPNVLGAAGLGYEKELDPLAYSAHAGSDESGKGDYFGPLVVCCAFTDERLSEEMIRLGVKDCKQMSDKAVLEVGAELRRRLGPSHYACVKIGPAAYNRIYAKIKNVNRLLAWGHGKAIEELLGKCGGPAVCGRVVVDQFAPTEATVGRSLGSLGRQAEIVQRHKAESDIAVAAASVIAREIFLREGMTVVDGERAPLGSSDPQVKATAVRMVGKYGPKWLMNHCKVHFQTTDKVLAECGLDRGALPEEGRVASLSMRRPAAEKLISTKVESKEEVRT